MAVRLQNEINDEGNEDALNKVADIKYRNRLNSPLYGDLK